MNLPDAICRGVIAGEIDGAAVALEQLGAEPATVNYSELLELFASAVADSRIRLIIADGTIESVLGYLWSLQASRATLVLPRDATASNVHDLSVRFGLSSILASRSTLDQLSLPESFSSVIGANGWFHFREYLHPRELNFKMQTTLLPTSGSTGQPKFVRLSNEGVLQNALDIQHALGMTGAEVAAGVLPLSYSYGLSVMHSTLIVGGRFLFGEPLQPLSRDFRNVLWEHRVTHLPGVPFTHDLYEKLGVHSEPSKFLKCVTQAGGRLEPEKVKRIYNKLSASGIRFHPMYGQTEASARISIMPHELVGEFPDFVGQVVPSGKLTIDAQSQEVVFEGPNVMLSYAEDFDSLEAPDGNNGFLSTGDKGEFGPHDLLRITGRLKRIAKINGNRVDLDAFASTLGSAGVVMTESRGRIVVGITPPYPPRRAQVLKLGPEFGLKARDFVFIQIDEIPRLSNGKIDYRGLGELG